LPELEGIAVITGAGSGLGAGLAEQAAARGMAVVAADVHGARLDALDVEVAARVLCDVRRYEDVERLAGVAYGLGEVGLLCNNAGVADLGPLWEQSVDTWHRLVDINLNGVYHGIKAFVPRMLASGRAAVVLNTASIGGFSTGRDHGAYQVTKHAVVALSQCLANDLADARQIHVAVACPGPVATRIFTDANESTVTDTMRDMLATQGMTGADAAGLLLDQVVEGRFWVTPHPDMFRQSVDRRVNALTAARDSF